MDLGRKLKSPGEVPASPVNEKEPKITYPQFDIRDEVADAFAKEYDCEVDDIVTATVRLRVSGVRKDEYGSSKTFEVLSMDNIAEEGEAEEPDPEEKVLGYKRPSKEAEVPDTSAAELEE